MNKCHKIVLYNKKKLPIELVRYINQYVPSKNCVMCNQYGISYSSIYLCNNNCRMIFIVKISQGITSACIFFTISLIGDSISAVSILFIVMCSVGMKLIHLIFTMIFYLFLIGKMIVILLCK